MRDDLQSAMFANAVTRVVTIGASRLQIASDLHIDAWLRCGNRPPFKPDPEADALILAGDLCNGQDAGAMEYLSTAFGDASLWPAGVYIVLGNHDHYGLRLGSAAEDWARLEEACPRTRILQRSVANMPLRDGRTLRIAGCTLWSDFRHGDPMEMLNYRWSSDCIYILSQSGSASGINPTDLLGAHQADRAWLDDLAPGSESSPLLVATHHAPSWRSADRRYAHNGGFVSKMDDVVERLSPVVWIHGHIHALQDFVIGVTRVVAHPIGYPGETIVRGEIDAMFPEEGTA